LRKQDIAMRTLGYFFLWMGYSLYSLSGLGVYAPTCMDFAMLDGKNDVRLDVAVLPISLGLRSTVSYGLTDHVLIQADAKYHDNQYYGQLVSGWYSNADSRVLEVLGGASVGYGNDRLHDRESWHSGNYITCFLQGNMGWKNLANKHIDVAFGARCGYYYASLINSAFFGNTVKEEDVVAHSFFVEPNINFRFGWEKLKFNLKTGYNFHHVSALCPGKGAHTGMGDFVSMELSLNYHF